MRWVVCIIFIYIKLIYDTGRGWHNLWTARSPPGKGLTASVSVCLVALNIYSFHFMHFQGLSQVRPTLLHISSIQTQIHTHTPHRYIPARTLSLVKHDESLQRHFFLSVLLLQNPSTFMDWMYSKHILLLHKSLQLSEIISLNLPWIIPSFFLLLH